MATRPRGPATVWHVLSAVLSCKRKGSSVASATTSCARSVLIDGYWEIHLFMTYKLVALCLFVLLVKCQTDDDWIQFKIDYNRVYPTAEEEAMRKDIWQQNVIDMNEFNSNPDNTYKKGISQLSDRTEAELAGLFVFLFSFEIL